MRPSIEVDDFKPLREILENDRYKFCYEEVLTQCYFRIVDFKKLTVSRGIWYHCTTKNAIDTTKNSASRAPSILMTCLSCMLTCHDRGAVLSSQHIKSSIRVLESFEPETSVDPRKG